VAVVVRRLFAYGFVLSKHGHAEQAEVLWEIVADVSAAIEDLVRFVDEEEAMRPTGRSRESRHTHLALWRKRGHVRQERGRRYTYRACLLGLILPRNEGMRYSSSWNSLTVRSSCRSRTLTR
jgi:hypothetical protein